MIMERNPELDFGLRYDDDYSLINYINNLNNPEKVNNIVFRNNDRIVVTERKNRDYELDTLPMPYRKLYDIEKYLKGILRQLLDHHEVVQEIVCFA